MSHKGNSFRKQHHHLSQIPDIAGHFGLEKHIVTD